MKNIEQDVCDLLNKTPNYAGLLEVVNGAFDPESFVADSSSQLRYYSVAPSSDGTISVIQGHQEGRDKSQRSDSFDYHTDGVYRPSLLPYLCLLARIQVLRTLVQYSWIAGEWLGNLLIIYRSWGNYSLHTPTKEVLTVHARC
jgi:hypothetical protein